MKSICKGNIEILKPETPRSINIDMLFRNGVKFQNNSLIELKVVISKKQTLEGGGIERYYYMYKSYRTT